LNWVRYIMHPTSYLIGSRTKKAQSYLPSWPPARAPMVRVAVKRKPFRFSCYGW